MSTKIKTPVPILDATSDDEKESIVSEENEEIDDDIVEADDEDVEVDEIISDEESEDDIKDDNKDDVELENCYYQFDNILEEVDTDITPKRVPDEDRITLNKLTKYEIVRILGIRAKQISVGAKVLIKNIDGKSPIEIAIYELKHKMTPFIIKRPLPNNTYELWKIKELDIDITPNDEQSIISFS